MGGKNNDSPAVIPQKYFPVELLPSELKEKIIGFARCFHGEDSAASRTCLGKKIPEGILCLKCPNTTWCGFIAFSSQRVPVNETFVITREDGTNYFSPLFRYRLLRHYLLPLVVWFAVSHDQDGIN